MRLRTVIVMFTAVLVLAACGGGGGSEDGGTASEERSEVTLWMYPVIPDEDASREFWKQVEADFEADHADTDLTIELQPWEGRDEKIATAIASGTGPDIVLLGPDQVLQYQTTGGLKPVDAAVADDRSEYLPAAVEAVTFGGDLYGVPIYHTSTTTVYNTEVLADAGIDDLPSTWDEIRAAAPALAGNGVAVLDYSGSPETTLNLTFYPLLWQAGGSIFNEDGTDVAFDGPEGVETLQFLLDLQEMGGLPADAATKSNAVEGAPLGSGTAAIGYSVVQPEVDQMIAGVGEENVEVALPLTGTEQVSFGIPGVLSLTSISDDDEAAMDVARYIASPEVAHDLNVASGTYPARSDVEPPADDEVTEVFQAALEFARPGEIAPSARQVMAALAPQIQAALQGQKSAQEALDDAAAEARDVLSREG